MAKMDNLRELENYVLSYFETNQIGVDFWGATVNRPHVENYLAISRRRFKLLYDIVCKNALQRCKVLEIGAAYGILLLALKNKEFNVYATEMQDNISIYCKALLDEGIEVRAWDLHTGTIPFAENKFPVIIASEVLEHLQVSLSYAISRMNEMLARGGLLIITTPNIYRLSHMLRILKDENICEPFPDKPVLKGGIVLDNRDHPREPTMKELVRAMKDSGLNIIKSNYYSFRNPRSFFEKVISVFIPVRLRDSLLVIGQKPLGGERGTTVKAV